MGLYRAERGNQIRTVTPLAVPGSCVLLRHLQALRPCRLMSERRTVLVETNSIAHGVPVPGSP
jgi:hypothetical protein